MPLETPFHHRTAHLCTALAWKEWAGFAVVRRFGASLDGEYHALRHGAGALDVSPLHKLDIRGPEAGACLASLWSKDVSRLKCGRGTYACLVDDAGRVIDDGTVFRLADDHFRVSTGTSVFGWTRENARGYEVEISDSSEVFAVLSLQGPTSGGIIGDLTGGAALRLKWFDHGLFSIQGQEVRISRTGYTGDLGYEIWVEHRLAEWLWDEVFRVGAARALTPVGLDALDMTRIEAGYILQGVEYDGALDATDDRNMGTPFEVGLGFTVDLDRPPFVGQAALRRGAEKPSRQLVGLEVDWNELSSLYEDAGLVAHLPPGAWREVVPLSKAGRQVGYATSGTWSPILKRYVVLASVRPAWARVGTRLRMEVLVDKRRRRVGATVVPRPFFDPDRKRA